MCDNKNVSSSSGFELSDKIEEKKNGWWTVHALKEESFGGTVNSKGHMSALSQDSQYSWWLWGSIKFGPCHTSNGIYKK